MSSSLPVNRPQETENFGAAPGWRSAVSHADHARSVAVRDSAMVQLGRGSANCDSIRAMGADCSIVRLKSAPRMSGYLVPDPAWAVITMPLGWSGDYVLNGRPVRPGDVNVVTSANGYASTGQDRNILGVGLRAERLRRTIATHLGKPGDEVSPGDCVLELGEAAGARFAQGILSILNATVQAAPGYAVVSSIDEDLLFEHIARTLCLSLPSKHAWDYSASGDLSIVRSAREMITASREVPTLADLCARLNIGQTRLNACFRSVHGMPPARFIRRLQLSRVHKKLTDAQAPPRSVKCVALAHGFTHGGRFAAEYRSVFGELPSETCQKLKKRFT
ncbi:AraC family transcriptional regulator [Roseobacter ponti]|uniref:AraC family transcriptional regulator n=1 Tax=Roseobacter ponti TaxID=1891787 RepID=A0A858STF8_9RHOB|nr:AraC family transcriptional regulator [Roseobacter ponti]QJF51965.1 AraC family transcriptional regulator [Roseobacter ponti]